MNLDNPVSRKTRVSSASSNLLKKSLLEQIIQVIERQQLTQIEAAALLKTTQPEISKLKKGPFTRFRIERLFYFLNCLGMNIDIYISEAKQTPHQRVITL